MLYVVSSIYSTEALSALYSLLRVSSKNTEYIVLSTYWRGLFYRKPLARVFIQPDIQVTVISAVDFETE